MENLKSKLTDLQKKLNAKILHLNQKQGEVRSLVTSLTLSGPGHSMQSSLSRACRLLQQLEAEVESLKKQ